MADLEISNLPDGAPLVGTEELAAEQSGTTVKTTAQEIADLATPPPVTSVFGRVDVVVPASGDYSATEVSFTPDGDIAASDVQMAIIEVRDDTDAKLAVKVFGEDYQSAVDETRTTTASLTPVLKLQLTTPVLTGTYLIQWSAVIDNSTMTNTTLARLMDTSNALIVGTQAEHEPKNLTNRIHVGESVQLVFAAQVRALELQFWASGATAGIQGARIQIWRVA